MRIKFYVSDLHCCGLVRADVIARVINRDFAEHSIDCKVNVFMSDFYRTDVMVFQRRHDPMALEKMRVAKKWGIKTVYDIDDDLFHIPKEFSKPFQFYSKPEVQRILDHYLNECDAVTVSTLPLAEEIRKHTSRPVYVVDNALDVGYWAREPMPSDTVTIGWMASGSHRGDVPLIKQAIANLMHEFPNVRIKLIGWVNTDDLPFLRQFEDRVEVLPWQDAEVLPDVMKDIDIGLCPLVDHQFNACKSSLKALQYWASKAAVAYSPTAPYECITDQVEGLACQTTAEWYVNLKKLVLNPDLRRQLGVNGYAKLVSEYNMDLNARSWLGLFSKIIND